MPDRRTAEAETGRLCRQAAEIASGLSLGELSMFVVSARLDNERKGKPTGHRLTEILLQQPGGPIAVALDHEPNNPAH